ncbi:hypothetical protein ES703_106067 [subsurface metagenome]
MVEHGPVPVHPGRVGHGEVFRAHYVQCLPVSAEYAGLKGGQDAECPVRQNVEGGLHMGVEDIHGPLHLPPVVPVDVVYLEEEVQRLGVPFLSPLQRGADSELIAWLKAL